MTEKIEKSVKLKPQDEEPKEVIPTEEEIRKMKHFKSVLRHIKHVQDAAQLLGERMMENGDRDQGRILIANSFKHDNSKFYGIEWEYMGAEEIDKDKLGLAILQHVTTNEHHPEYWGDIKQMPRVYIAEMVCDWYARSVEFGSDLRAWIKDYAMDRFGFTTSTKIYKEIKQFVDILLDKRFS